VDEDQLRTWLRPTVLQKPLLASPSEEQLGAKLDNARRVGAPDISEIRQVGIVVPIVTEDKLRMVEGVEELRPKLQAGAFRQPVCFSTAMSQLLRPGPWKNRRLAVPSTPSFSWLNMLVSKYGCPVRGSWKVSFPPEKLGVSIGN
jgi:hypothetical protein